MEKMIAIATGFERMADHQEDDRTGSASRIKVVMQVRRYFNAGG
jgi:hypothetical protein